MRTTLLSAALVMLAMPAFAGSIPVDAPVLAAGPAAAPAPARAPSNNDEDEEEAPKATSPKPGGTATTPPPAAQATTQGAVSAPAASEADQQKLVSGAPLYNPNVAVHIVEKKEFSDKNRLEVEAQAAIQVNGKFTQHFGAALSLVFHLHENFGLFAMGVWNPYNTEAGFNNELINKVRAEAQAATSVLLNGGVIGGVEATPFYGKFVWFENYLVHFSLVVNAGAGAGSTRLQLKTPTDCTNATGTCFPDATYGDMGWRFMGELGGGFRVQIGKWVAIRLELRDLLYSAHVDSVNGCNSADLKALDAALTAGMPLNRANVSGNCNVMSFSGTAQNGRSNSLDVPLAFGLVKTPSSDVLNNLGLYVGVSGNFF
jgi:outer membrane beta-barrel protein